MKLINTLLKVSLLSIVPTMLVAQNMQISKVEPPNWWAGMANDTVQVMVYGNNVKNAIFSINAKDAKVVNVFAQDDDYAFVSIVGINKIKPQTITITAQKGSEKTKIDFPVLEKDKFMPGGFSRKDVVYLIMPDRFANGNKANDNVAGMEQSNPQKVDGRHGGDLSGIIKNLPYIKNLGVTSIWLTPFQEMNDQQGSYHGYGASNFYEADARYTSGMRGSKTNNEQYCAYVNACHQNGIKVVMDVVLNHIGGEHEWMKHYPRINNWVHDSLICNFQMPTLTDPYATQKDKNSMEKGWFVPSMPDLNQDNPRMATYLIQNNIWWIQTAKIDAIRLDTAPFSEKNFLTKWASALHKQYPTLSLVGEVWSIIQQPNSVKYWQQSSTNKDGYNSQIPSVMDLPLWESMIQGLQNDDATKPYYCLSQDYIYDKPMDNFILLGNHDMERYYTSIGENLDKYKLGLVWLATMRGIPQLYYGDEILMTGKKGINDGLMREDMQFEEQISKSENKRKALTFNQLLWNWRKSNDVIADGKLMHYYPKDGVYIYKRYTNNKAVIVMLNFKNKNISIDPNDYKELFGNYSNFKQISFGTSVSSKEINVVNGVAMLPYQSLIIEAQ
jgi:neopullulanase